MRPGEISVAMEPPHPSFWIEASPDMPDVLKERCIDAFEKLHARKVLHGDVELRHMLIGGDAKVTLIDFQASRSLDPDDAVMLRSAKPAEFLLEMRKVKFKLNYQGSREKESNKVMAFEARTARNKMRRQQHKRKARGERLGPISDYEEDPPEDKTEPPVNKQDWNENWVIAADAVPTRFVMPGQSPEDIEREIQSFLAIVDRMKSEQTSTTHDASRSLSTPPPSPPQPPLILQDSQTSSPSEGTDDPSPRPVKRQRSEATPSTLPSHSSAWGKSNTHTRTHIPAPLPGNLSQPFPNHSVPPTARRSSAFNVPTASHSNAASSSSALPPPDSSKSRFPPIKVRDFAYEPYTGPRGFYVPHLPTEARAKLELRSYFARLRAEKFTGTLPPSMAHLNSRMDPGLLRHAPPQRGSLKRSREDSDGHETSPWPSRKKTKHELAKMALGEASSSRKRKRCDNDGMGVHIALEGMPDFTGGPGTSSKYPLRSGGSMSSSPIGIQNILHKRPRWPSKDLRVNTLKKTVMHYQPPASTSTCNGSEAYNFIRKNGTRDRSGDLMALATLGVGFPPSPSRHPRRNPKINGRSPLSGGVCSFERAGTSTAHRGVLPPPRRKLQYHLVSAPSSSYHTSYSTIDLASPEPPSSLLDEEEREVESLLRPLDVVMDCRESSSESSFPSTWMGFFRYIFG